MIDWGGKVAAWLGAVAIASAALAVFAQAAHGPLYDMFIVLVVIAAVAFVGLLLTGLRAVWVAWRTRRSNQRPATPEVPASPTGPGSGSSEDSLPAGSPIVLRGGPASGREVLHGSHPEDYVTIVGGIRHAWRHTDPQAWAPPDRTRPVYDYIGRVV